jgi:hypothetical protein
MKWALTLLTRTLPSAILKLTKPLSTAPPPPLPEDVEEISDSDLADWLIEAGTTTGERTRAAVPAAGLLGTIAGLFKGTLAYPTLLVVLAAATILAALFGESARVETGPGRTLDREMRSRSVFAVRRKEAWSRLASYLAFALAFLLIADAALT